MSDQSRKKPEIPRKASTFILVRNHISGFQAFLLRRHQGNIFMGGNFVYPGGRVERGDFEPAMMDAASGITEDEANTILGLTDLEVPGLAYWIAGIRELFEEAGILLAYTHEGKLLSFERDSIRDRFASHREALQTGSKNLLQIIREEKLTLALDRCYYYAHWITPEARKVRFDTRFFVVTHMADQEAIADNRETTHGMWISPMEALQENLSGTIVLSPPTLKTLEYISKFKTISDLLSVLPLLAKPAILPILIDPSGDEVLIFPWDPEYRLFKEGKISKPVDNGDLCGLQGNTTRLVLKDGHWLPYVKTG